MVAALTWILLAALTGLLLVSGSELVWCWLSGVRVLPDAVPCIVTTAERLNESIQAASEALEDAHSQNTALSDGEIVIGLHDVLTSCEAVPGMLASWETVPGMDSMPEILDDITGVCIEMGMTLA